MQEYSLNCVVGREGGGARSLGIWPPGGNEILWIWPRGGRDHGGTKSLGHRVHVKVIFHNPG